MSKKTFPAVGLSSLLVIFAVLCLVVFALLTASAARAEARLSDQNRVSVLGYYRAELDANTRIAELRQAGTQGIHTFRCPISPTQALEVEVEITGAACRILRWQTVSTAEWQTDEKLPVWQG